MECRCSIRRWTTLPYSSGNPVRAVEAALGADNDLVLAHVLRAYLHLYATSADGVSHARKILDALHGVSDIDEREVLHLRAARSWASGQWDDATHFLDRALLHDARDLLALKVAQDLYFFLGQTKDLLRVAARARSAWPPERPGWGSVEGMYAFGLEENGEYLQAEASARAALHKEPRDTWASHALAHVFEMQGRQVEGIAFMNDSSQYWASSYFAVHNWWHEALYHLELEDIDRVLSLYDGPIRGARSTEWLDLVDAASLLWRVLSSSARSISGFMSWPPTLSRCWGIRSTSSMIGTSSWSSAWPGVMSSASRC